MLGSDGERVESMKAKADETMEGFSYRSKVYFEGVNKLNELFISQDQVYSVLVERDEETAKLVLRVRELERKLTTEKHYVEDLDKQIDELEQDGKRLDFMEGKCKEQKPVEHEQTDGWIYFWEVFAEEGTLTLRQAIDVAMVKDGE